MQVSLTQLIQQQRDIKPAPGLVVHYPEDGHARLASVEEHHFWFTERRSLIHRLLLRFLEANRRERGAGSSFAGIDLGCGSGYTAVWLTERGIPTYGQDVYAGFKALRDQGRGLGFVQGDITSVDLAPEFDFALLLDVIEHVPDDRAFVDHVGKLLKPGGLLVITVPAFSWLWSGVDDDSGHLRRYVRKDFRAFERLPSTRYTRIFSNYFYASTLPLYFASRMASKLGKQAKRSASSAELAVGPWANATLKAVLRAEAGAFFTIGVPVGSSLFVVMRKAVTHRTEHGGDDA